MSENKINHKESIEAILFAAGGAIDLNTICKITNATKKELKPIIETLIKEYNTRESGLEILDIGSRFVMQIKPKYTEFAISVAPKELSSPILRTLSIIAYHQPVTQSRMIEMRGNSAYAHVKELKERGFVKAVPHGRTKLLKTTQMFSDYFGLDSKDPELIKEKIAELSQIQSGTKSLGRRFIVITPMYASLIELCGIKNCKVVDVYKPTIELGYVRTLIISKGYKEKVSNHTDAEIIEISTITFDDFISSIQLIESNGIANAKKSQEIIKTLKELKEKYISKAIVIDKKVNPETKMIAKMVKELRLGISNNGVCIAPDYKTSSTGKEIGVGAEIIVPTHQNIEGDLIERICKKYDAIIDGLLKK